MDTSADAVDHLLMIIITFCGSRLLFIIEEVMSLIQPKVASYRYGFKFYWLSWEYLFGIGSKNPILF